MLPHVRVTIAFRRLLAGFAVATALVGAVAARADEVDTEHLFSFLVGTDIGNVGDKEFETETTGRLVKRTGAYAALSQVASIEYTPARDVRIELNAVTARHDIAGVTDLDDLHRSAFAGATFEMRYRLLDRAQSPFGLAVRAEPHWLRVDETSGQRADQYGVDLALMMDKELVPDRIIGAFNLFYEPQVSRSPGGAWSRDATLGVGLAAMVQVQPGLLIGPELRHLREYASLGPRDPAGHATFLGPSLFAKLSEHLWLTAAWSVQVAGHANGEDGALDLANFTRHEARLRLGYEF
jgi:hypothetical protein